jgi:uncharacterized membrane protein YeaQ/YmgE (transglycosylase-associated protein family)
MTKCHDRARRQWETGAGIKIARSLSGTGDHRPDRGRSNPMGFIAWIVVGAIAGFLANQIMGSREGLVMMVILGIVGGLVGGFLATSVFKMGSVDGINIESIFIATIGAILVVVVVNALQGGRGLRAGPR